MARTTKAAVALVMGHSLTDAQVDQFISDASNWVTDNLSSEGLSATRLEIIERYLTCDGITLRDPRATSKSLDKVSEKYQRDPKVSEYLLRAAAADPTGIVRGTFLNQDKATTIRWKAGLFDPED